MLLAALFVLAAASSQPPQRPSPAVDPPLTGRRIEAKDGDTVVIRDKARVRILYRTDARIRALYNSAQRWLVVLADYVDPQSGAPDGIADVTLSFYGVEDTWPLGDRWEGSAVLDDYSGSDMPGGGLGVTTDAGLVQLLPSSSTPRWFVDARATVVSFRGNGRRGPGRLAFDQAEAQAVAEAQRTERQRVRSESMTMTIPREDIAAATMRASAPGDPPPQAPVRVGSVLVTPVKIRDVRPVRPPEAVRAGVKGIVVVELTIGVDGSVTHAKILRSIALLDRAALDAVRQWRYEPTLLEGRPVPIITTVTVPFD